MGSNERGATDRPSPAISVVLPVYRNATTLDELYARLRTVLEAQALPFELLFVDDACPENSLTVLERLAHADPRVGVIAHQTNGGQHRAIMTGLRHARGDLVAVMDADLQDPPEALPLLIEGIRSGPAAVFAGRRGRHERGARQITSHLFKGVLHLLTGVPADAGSYVVMSRQMVTRLLGFGEPNPYLLGMIGGTRLPLVVVPVARAERPRGTSAYSTRARLRLAWRALSRALYWRWRGARSESQA